MKNIILTLLKKGYTNSKKYSVEDLNHYLFNLSGLFVNDGNIIKASNNAFWDYKNIKNRKELLRDIKGISRRNIKDLAYFRILNRFANGDKYGVQTY